MWGLGGEPPFPRRKATAQWLPFSGLGVCLWLVDVPLLIREVRRVGYNIDQILMIARAQGLVDVPQLQKAMAENRALVKKITNEYAMTEE